MLTTYVSNIMPPHLADLHYILSFFSAFHSKLWYKWEVAFKKTYSTIPCFPPMIQSVNIYKGYQGASQRLLLEKPILRRITLRKSH